MESLETSEHSKLRLIEALVIMVVTIIPAFMFPKAKGVLSIVPLIYFFIERRIRKKTFKESGFDISRLKQGIIENWLLIFIVSVLIQIGVSLFFKEYWPEMFSHVKSRLPQIVSLKPSSVFLTIGVATFGEEIIFRVLLQQRLNWFLRTPYAIVISSLLFAATHFSSDFSLITAFDILLVFIDSLFYGAIFARTQNIYVSWFAHFLADIVGLALLIGLSGPIV